jgi:ABC-type ATPase involved in cell division
VFQSYNLIPHQNVLRNVELALTISGISGEQRRIRAEEALREVGLEEHIDKKPAQLSGGQMQRVAIARALVNDPDILLADEPTGNLDPANSWEIMKLLEEANARGTTVIVVTHNHEIVNAMKKRVITMQKGNIVSDTKRVGL